MAVEGPPDDYYVGLLDSLLRVRFHVETDAGPRFHPNPSVRIGGRMNDYLVALVGELLEILSVTFELVAPEQGHEYFSVHKEADFQKLYDFVKGQSTQAVEELGFLTETYQTTISPQGALTPDEMYRLARTIDKLHRGTKSSGRAILTDPVKFSDEYEITDTDCPPYEIPSEGFRDDYPIEYIAGIIDALAIFRPAIGSSSYGIGYTMIPQIRLHRSGVHPAFALSVKEFCEQRNLTYTNLGEMQHMNTVINGATAIDEFAPVVGPYLVAKREELAYLHSKLVSRFLNEDHHTKQGFYELVVDFEPILSERGCRHERQKYTPEYFEEVWAEEITPVERDDTATSSPD